MNLNELMSIISHGRICLSLGVGYSDTFYEWFGEKTVVNQQTLFWLIFFPNQYILGR